jgi:hypothetical protein
LPKARRPPVVPHPPTTRPPEGDMVRPTATQARLLVDATMDAVRFDGDGYESPDGPVLASTVQAAVEAGWVVLGDDGRLRTTPMGAAVVLMFPEPVDSVSR